MNDDSVFVTVRNIRRDAIRLCLDGSVNLSSLSVNRLAQIYNGTGPEWMPARFRSWLDDLFQPFLPAVMIHDYDFSMSDGTVESFDAANTRLKKNCYICARAAYPWYHPKRYLLEYGAEMLYKACHEMGWSSYRINH